MKAYDAGEKLVKLERSLRNWWVHYKDSIRRLGADEAYEMLIKRVRSLWSLRDACKELMKRVRSLSSVYGGYEACEKLKQARKEVKKLVRSLNIWWGTN